MYDAKLNMYLDLAWPIGLSEKWAHQFHNLVAIFMIMSCHVLCVFCSCSSILSKQSMSIWQQTNKIYHPSTVSDEGSITRPPACSIFPLFQELQLWEFGNFTGTEATTTAELAGGQTVRLTI